jgi:transmembrane sensor
MNFASRRCIKSFKPTDMAATELPDQNHLSPGILQQEAGIWLVRLTADDVTQADVQAFKRWQRTSDAHRAAFDEAKLQWKLMKPALSLMLATQNDHAERQAYTNKPGAGRRRFIQGAFGAAAVAGVAVVYPPMGLWPALATWGADYRTGVGEQRALVMGQDVSVTLNTQTSIQQVMQGGEAIGMHLLEGEVAVDLPAHMRTFVVQAGAGKNSAVDGRFTVKYLQGAVCVTCLEGSVDIEHPAGMRQLAARQSVIYRQSQFEQIVSVDEEDATSWRKGELVFRQVPLVQVLQEINRYRTGHVMLMKASVEQEKVSGRFPIAILDDAVLQIQHSFGLNARTLPGGVLIFS